MTFGGFRSMWILVMFDLPVDTKASRKAAHDFRVSLLQNGFARLQYSVYARHTPSEENASVHENRVRTLLPADGEVRLMKITDKQFERMRVFCGKIRKPTEKAPEQISFF